MKIKYAFIKIRDFLERNKIFFETFIFSLFSILSIIFTYNTYIATMQQVNVDDYSHLPNFDNSPINLDEPITISGNNYSSVIQIVNSGGIIKNSSATFQAVLTVYSIKNPKERWYFTISNYGDGVKKSYDVNKKQFMFYRNSIDSKKIVSELDQNLRLFDENLYIYINETVKLEYTDYKSVVHSDKYILNEENMLVPQNNIYTEYISGALSFTGTNYKEQAEKIYRLTTHREE